MQTKHLDGISMENISKYAKAIEWSNKKFPKHKILDSLSPNQISSKIWIKEVLTAPEAPRIYGPWYNGNGKPSMDGSNSIEIVGSWYVYPLLEMLESTIKINKVDCWDIDFEARQISRYYLKLFAPKYQVKVYSQDYFYHDRKGSRAHLLINTSSEHMYETFADRPENFYVKNPLIVIQSNNMRNIGEHINCVDSAEELINKHRISRVFYQGEKDIVEWHGTSIRKTLGKYKRFMVIGLLR